MKIGLLVLCAALAGCAGAPKSVPKPDMDAKSVITSPSPGQTLAGAGVHEVTGLAWSGHGAIVRVDVTVDGGRTWVPAELQTPVLPRAHTRFRWSWRWDGREALIASRATDDTWSVPYG